ncbi:hypothetical protein BE08_01720 [Sorangium cellulosum]|uniref:Uncharacterized protein n=1 Tax=Sorangium cellulosum TaxID=56 RepID=A0A150P2Y6_SORCE|nr:hypothetical protein BE08_01720 [Sorangium cellulosum]
MTSRFTPFDIKAAYARAIERTSYNVVGALHTSAAAPDEDASPTVLFSRLADLSSNEAKALVVDPATVELIVSIGGLVLDLFSGDDSEEHREELRAIGLWAQKVDGQLHRLNLALEDIREELSKTPVYMDRAFRRDAEYALLSYCEAYVTNIAAYRQTQSHDLKRIITDLYVPLQSAARKLMYYGYANVVSVAYALRPEIDLVRILELGRSTEATVARTYYDFFDTALDPNVTGSLVNAAASMDAKIDELTHQHSPGFKGFVGDAWWYKDNFRQICHKRRHPGDGPSCEMVWDYHRIHPGYEITGSLAGGFDAHAVVMPDGHVFADSSRDHNSAYLIGRDAALAEATRLVRDKILPTYQRGSIKFNELVADRPLLTQALLQCERFREVAARLSGAA